MDLSILKKKINDFNEVMKNTSNYRKIWDNELRDLIVTNLESFVAESEVKADVDVHDQYSGLEAVALIMGIEDSGIYERLDGDLKKNLIRSNGSLLFQQLFNGKISIWINYPFIEGIGEPKPPMMLEIVRPAELKEINILRYFERFIDEITAWEDFDDDKTPIQSIGFNHPQAKITN